jgi:hypothetical protein
MTSDHGANRFAGNTTPCAACGCDRKARMDAANRRHPLRHDNDHGDAFSEIAAPRIHRAFTSLSLI